MITQKQLKALFDYNPETGAFIRKLTGLEEYVIDAYGYKRIWARGTTRPVHRMAVLYMTGQEPASGMVTDHINQDRLDNRWENLRVVTNSQNQMNRGIGKNNTSGATGVMFKKGKWEARLKKDGVVIGLGRYATKEAAIVARKLGEILHFGENRNKVC